MYVFLIYFLTDFDREGKVCTFFYYCHYYFKQREKGIVTTHDTDH